jgi:predicted N-acyltransferase
MLHFELCYYRLIERAIERRCTLFEAGAQGEHKLKRGLAPAFTHSAHWIRHRALGEAIGSFIEREAAAVAEEARLFDEYSPFRKASERDE